MKYMEYRASELIAVLGLSALSQFLLLISTGFSQTPFYQGKTIVIIQGREPGASGDMRVRALMPYLSKYIPGRPNVVTEYMAGGGGRKAANYIYTSVRPDGLVIGNVGAGLVSNAALGEPGVSYNLDKLIYLGSSNSTMQHVFVTRKELGLNTLEKLGAHSGLRVGGQAVGHDSYITARLFAWIVGLKEPRFVAGYAGGPQLDLALMRGEVGARAQTADWLLQKNLDWLDKGLVNLHAIFEVPRGEKHPRFVNLPELETFARSEREHKLLAMSRAFRLAGSPFFLPPGIPRERIEILQEAMRKTFRDPEFWKEYKKLGGDEPTPLMPEAHERAIKELPRDPATVELFKRIASDEALPAR